MKICKKCGAEFSGVECRICKLERCAKYREENRDKVRAASKKWRLENPDKAKKSTSIWYEKNKDRGREVNSLWNKNHPESMRLSAHNYRAKKRINGGVLTKGLSERLYGLQKGLCACGCGQELGDNYHLDHIMPVALGGANKDWNMQLLTELCNKKKSKKHPVDFMQERGFLL